MTSAATGAAPATRSSGTPPAHLSRRSTGPFRTHAQVGFLLLAALASFVATRGLRGKDHSGYFTKLVAMLAFACFVLNIAMLGQIFNITPSDRALIPWATLAFLLAYSCDLRLLLAAGILCVIAYLSARTGTWSGMYWLHFGERPENFLPAALTLFVLPSFLHREHAREFAPIYRVFGLLTLLLPVLVLSLWGDGSYLDLDAGDAPPYPFHGYGAGGGTAAWLDEARMTALGFELAQDRNTAERTTKRYRTKEVLLVLELDGAAYRQALERARRNADDETRLNAANPDNKEFELRAKQAAEHAHGEAKENSRLFVVDAGLDAEALRAQYPDKAHYLIARGQIRPRMTRDKQDRLAGYISALSVSQINVPEKFQHALRQDGQANKAVHFEATVAYGKRLEPWLLALTEKGEKQAHFRLAR